MNRCYKVSVTRFNDYDEPVLIETRTVYGEIDAMKAIEQFLDDQRVLPEDVHYETCYKL